MVVPDPTFGQASASGLTYEVVSGWAVLAGDLDTPGPNVEGVMPFMPDFSSFSKGCL